MVFITRTCNPDVNLFSTLTSMLFSGNWLFDDEAEDYLICGNASFTRLVYSPSPLTSHRKCAVTSQSDVCIDLEKNLIEWA